MTPQAGALRRLQNILYRRPNSLHSTPKFQRKHFIFTKVHSSWSFHSIYRPALYAIQVALCFHLLVNHIGFIARTAGPSMVPTLSAGGDCVVVSRLQKRGRGVKVGDLIDFDHPLIPEMGAIKRVIGMPGDFVVKGAPAGGRKVIMGAGGLLERLGGEDPDEGYGMETPMIQIPEGHCWVMGDNLPESRDSRTYGPLPLGLIKGRVIAKVWPLEEATWLDNTLQSINE